MFGCFHLQVTRNDDNSCILMFSKPRTATSFHIDGILVELFHPAYGIIHRIFHSFSNCELNSEMCSNIVWKHPVLPAPFDVQLWPRRIEIVMGNVVWQATAMTIFERRPDKISQVRLTETSCISEPPTPFLTQDGSEEDLNIP